MLPKAWLSSLSYHQRCSQPTRRVKQDESAQVRPYLDIADHGLTMLGFLGQNVSNLEHDLEEGERSHELFELLLLRRNDLLKSLPERLSKLTLDEKGKTRAQYKTYFGGRPTTGPDTRGDAAEE